VRIIFFLSALLFSLNGISQPMPVRDSAVYYIKVHFLYGSRPLQKYKSEEPKWFGGVLGGHVGIESDSGQILNFRGNGKFHVFNSKKNKHSTYDMHSFPGFYSILGSPADSVKKVIVTIPVTATQKKMFDSISNAYLKEPPYDYALFGYRCGAAAYDILAKLGIMQSYSYQRTYMKIFYPQKLRRRLLSKAEENKWLIERQEGTSRRKWEKH
jgi:hypothetical protein